MRFKPGQQVVCIHHAPGWWDSKTGMKSIGPKFNNVYTVGHYTGESHPDYGKAITLKEFGFDHSYGDLLFEPLSEITELIEILEHQPAEI